MRTARILAVAVVLCTLMPTVAAAQSCCEVTERFEAAYDALLNLIQPERQDALARHLPWGVGARSTADAAHQDFFPNLDPLTGRTEAAMEQFQAQGLWSR